MKQLKKEDSNILSRYKESPSVETRVSIHFCIDLCCTSMYMFVHGTYALLLSRNNKNI